MKPAIFRAAFLLLGALIQVSLSNVMFLSPIVSPPILLAMVVSITLFHGFSFSWRWAVVAGLFVDALALGRLGHASIEFVLFAAILSLTSKEILFEYHAGRIFFLGGLIWIFEGVFRFLEVFMISLLSKESISPFIFFSTVSWVSIPVSILVSLIVCSVVLPLTFSFERYLDLFEQTKISRRR